MPVSLLAYYHPSDHVQVIDQHLTGKLWINILIRNKIAKEEVIFKVIATILSLLFCRNTP